MLQLLPDDGFVKEILEKYQLLCLLRQLEEYLQQLLSIVAQDYS
jgi:hypothetical protein